MDGNDFQLVFLDGAAHFIIEESPDVVVEHVLKYSHHTLIRRVETIGSCQLRSPLRICT